MKSTLVGQIRERIGEKTAEELLKIWEENDRQTWSTEAFEAVRQILTDCGVTITAQRAVQEPKEEKEIWRPKKEHGLTRKRLKDTSVWPKTYVHPSLTPKIKLYGEWILDNYSYLIKVDNAVNMKKCLWLHIAWPKKDTRPNKKMIERITVI